MDGIQSWSQGEFPCMTFPVVWNERLGVGYIRVVHLDGRRSPKLPFRNFGDSFRIAHQNAEYVAAGWLPVLQEA